MYSTRLTGGLSTHLNSHQTTCQVKDYYSEWNCNTTVSFSLLCMSKLFTLVSRCLAIFTITIVAKLWILLILFLHVSFSSVGLYIIRASSKQIIGTGLKDLVYNTFHLFDLVRAYKENLRAETIYLRVFFFIESVTFFLIWFFTAGSLNMDKEVFLIVTLSLLTLGDLILILEIIHRHSCKLKSIHRSCMVFNICNTVTSFHRSRLKEEPSPSHQIRDHTDNGTAHPIVGITNYMNTAIAGRDQRPQTCQQDAVLTTPPIHDEHQPFKVHVHPTMTSQGAPAVGDFSQVSVCCAQINPHDYGCSGSLGVGELSISSGGYNTSGISVDPSQCSSNITPTTSSNTVGTVSDNTSTSVEFLELDLDPVYYVRPQEMDTVSMGNYRLIPEHRTVSKHQDQQGNTQQYLNDFGHKVQGRVIRNVSKFHSRHSRSCKRKN